MTDPQPHDDLQPIPKTLPEDVSSMPQDDNRDLPLHNSLEQSIQAQIDTMVNMVESITQSVEQLQSDFETKIRYDESKERTITTLHRELQDYRDDLVLKHLRPLVNDLIKMYDDVGRVVTSYPVERSEEVDHLLRNIQDFRLDIEEMLGRNGIEVYEVSGDSFDSSRQRVHQVIPTDQSDLDGRVALRVRVGFNYGERIIRHEVVNVYRFTVPTQS